MRPLHLTLTNFKSHGLSTIDLSSVRVGLVTGANGAGKSTILDAIVWALYGADGLGLGRQSDRVIREGEEEATVRLLFESGGDTYEIVRTRRITGKSTLALARRNQGLLIDLTKGTIADTQAKIVEIVGASSETFLQSVYVGQGEAGRFAKATPAERKATLAQALDVDQYVGLRTAAKERQREVELQIVSLQRRIDDATDQLVGAPADDDVARALRDVTSSQLAADNAVSRFEELRKQLADARVAAAANVQAKEHADHLQRLAVEAGQAQVAAEQVWRSAEARANENRSITNSTTGMEIPESVDTTDLVARAETAQAAWTLADQRKGEAARILGELSTARSRVQSLEAELVQARSSVDSFTRQLDSSSEGEPCVTCAQPLGQEAAATARETINAQLRTAKERVVATLATIEQAQSSVWDLQRQADEFRSYATDLQRADEELKTAREALRVAEAQNKRHSDAAELVAKAATAKAMQAELDQQAAAAMTRMQAAADAYEKAAAEASAALALVKSSSEIETLTQMVEVADRDVSEAQTVLAAAQVEATRLEERFNAAQQVLQSISGYKATLQELQTERDEWATLVRAYGRDGIPAQMILHARPQIESDINQILGKVGAPYRVRLDLQRDTKAGTVQDTLDLTILADGHERPFDLLSGGEKYRVAIAMRVAIGRVLANRSGRRISTLVLDEPEGLDAAGFSALSELITTLGSEFDLVLTVSHSDGLDAAADARIHVTKESGRSLVHVAA